MSVATLVKTELDFSGEDSIVCHIEGEGVLGG